MRWNTLKSEIVWFGPESPATHMRLLPPGLVAEDLVVVADVMRAFLDRAPLSKAATRQLSEDGLYIATRFLLAQGAMTKPPARARIPLLVLAGAFASIEFEYGEGRKRDFMFGDLARRQFSAWLWAAVLTPKPLRGRRDGLDAADELAGWIEDGVEPPRVMTYQGADLEDVLDAPEAGERGLRWAIDAVLARRGAQDIFSGEPVIAIFLFNSLAGDTVDRHHVFPYAWCARHRKPIHRRESLINHVPASARANRASGGQPPSAYLRARRDQDGVRKSRINALLRSQLIDPVALWDDDFDAFYVARREALAETLRGALAVPT